MTYSPKQRPSLKSPPSQQNIPLHSELHATTTSMIATSNTTSDVSNSLTTNTATCMKILTATPVSFLLSLQTLFQFCLRLSKTATSMAEAAAVPPEIIIQCRISTFGKFSGNRPSSTLDMVLDFGLWSVLAFFIHDAVVLQPRYRALIRDGAVSTFLMQTYQIVPKRNGVAKARFESASLHYMLDLFYAIMYKRLPTSYHCRLHKFPRSHLTFKSGPKRVY